jgi:hypothetical protein
MKAITQTTPYSPVYTTSRPGFLSRFFKWCTGQEENRLEWLGVALAVHGCIITPLIIILITMTGNNFILWITGMVAMGAALVVNLAAMPTKITLPVFFASLLVDLGIAAVCIAQAAAHMTF